jgi:mono/diheme cytochrome c family protein
VRTHLVHRGLRNRKRDSLVACGFAIFTAALVGCDERHNMEEDAHLKPFEGTRFFAGGSSAQAPIDGTIARRDPNERTDDAYLLGKQGDAPVAKIPVPVTHELVLRGRQRFNIYCVPCHDFTGGGNGMIVQRGYSRPPALYEDRLIAAPDGHFYDVITNGYGKMPPYAAQVPVEDRWAITAYIRALQLSQRATAADLPAPVPAASNSGATPGGEGAHH